MTESDILRQIHELVGQEHSLRQRTQAGQVDPATEREQLRRLEQTLDQCWDLLRQWRARKEFGQEEDIAIRPVDQVEGYLG